MDTAHLFSSSAFMSIIMSGLIATAIMSAFVLAFNHTRVLPVDPLEAIGSMFNSEPKEAWRLGVLLHVATGLGAAFLYAHILKLVGMVGMLFPVAGAAMIGLVHGYVLSFIIVISLGENGTTSEIRTQGMSQAGIYLVAHLIYGTALGVMFAMMPGALLS